MKKRKAETKTETIKLRVTVEEKEALEAVAKRKRISLSRWLVVAALGGLDA